MKKHLIMLAVASAALSGCSQEVVPLTCEGIATGIDIVVHNSNKMSDKDLVVVREIRDDVYPICTSGEQPSTTEAAQHLIKTNAERLNNILSNYKLEVK